MHLHSGCRSHLITHHYLAFTQRDSPATSGWWGEKKLFHVLFAEVAAWTPKFCDVFQNHIKWKQETGQERKGRLSSFEVISVWAKRPWLDSSLGCHTDKPWLRSFCKSKKIHHWVVVLFMLDVKPANKAWRLGAVTRSQTSTGNTPALSASSLTASPLTAIFPLFYPSLLKQSSLAWLCLISCSFPLSLHNLSLVPIAPSFPPRPPWPNFCTVAQSKAKSHFCRFNLLRGNISFNSHQLAFASPSLSRGFTSDPNLTIWSQLLETACLCQIRVRPSLAWCSKLK